MPFDRSAIANLTYNEAEKFYEVHKARPFYNDLVKFMTSGPMPSPGRMAILGWFCVDQPRWSSGSDI